MLTIQMRSRGVRSYTALPLNEYTTGTPPNPTSSVNRSRKLRRADTTHDPFPRVDGPFEDGAGAGEAERGPPAELLAVALALGHLQHARRAVDVGRGVAAGEEGHVLQELGIEQADGAARRRKVRERVDVGNLDVVHHEQVLEGAAAADDDVVAKVVGADHDARQGLHVARHVLQGGGALEDLARLHQEARVLHLFRRLEGRRGHRDGLLEASTAGSVISTVPSSPARTSTGSLVNGRPASGRISRR